MTKTHTTLYRFFDSKGRLLYVGVSKSPLVRLGQHRSEKPWWSQIETTRMEHFPSKEEAYKAETVAISVENPIFNISGRKPVRRKRSSRTQKTYSSVHKFVCVICEEESLCEKKNLKHGDGVMCAECGKQSLAASMELALSDNKLSESEMKLEINALRGLLKVTPSLPITNWVLVTLRIKKEWVDNHCPERIYPMLE